MKIVFYSTNSNQSDSSTFKIDVLPTNESQFTQFKVAHPNDSFFCISQSPAMFMPEESTLLLPPQTSPKEFAQKIAEFSPDLAIALTFWVAPYDWLTINDALVAEELQKIGITTICNSVETGLICFDKYRTSQFLEKNNFINPHSIFVDHDLYFCAGSQKSVIKNVYKISVENQIKKLKLPLIIKDTVGLSSYGMTVVNTYGEAICYLNSKRNNSNRLVEEYIAGEHFGTEIYGCNDEFQIMPPFKFTTNQYGITSPKQSSKTGPLSAQENIKYKIDDLYATLQTLAHLLNIQGVAQVDLIFSENNWYIIEVNPRLSGMSYMYSAGMGLNIFETIYKSCILKEKLPHVQKLYDEKLPIMTKTEIEELFSHDEILLLNQTNNLEAKQEREKGFCECVRAR